MTPFSPHQIFHVYDFRRGKLAAIFLTLGYDQMCDKSFYISFIVDKCTIDNGGCDVSAVCTNPTKAGEDVVCSCLDPLTLDDTGKSCGEKFVDNKETYLEILGKVTPNKVTQTHIVAPFFNSSECYSIDIFMPSE